MSAVATEMEKHWPLGNSKVRLSELVGLVKYADVGICVCTMNYKPTVIWNMIMLCVINHALLTSGSSVRIIKQIEVLKRHSILDYENEFK